MIAAERLWRTRDGERLVHDGDPDAAILAYAAGDQIAKADEGKVPGNESAEEKAKPTPANKARRKPADK